MNSGVAVTEGDALATLSACVNESLQILDRERQVFLSGAYEEVAGITQAKIVLLDRLEDAIRMAPPSKAVVALVQSLIAASRRNEQIIEAARQGFLFARRRLNAIANAASGAVAYAEDGTQISSRADMLSKERHA